MVALSIIFIVSKFGVIFYHGWMDSVYVLTDTEIVPFFCANFFINQKLAVKN